MGSLADFIEQYLRQILGTAGPTGLEVQRRELARIFRCAPSQINYVLETRFTVERGYMVESRRGGGGFIRIRRVDMGGHYWPRVEEAIGPRIRPQEAETLLIRLLDEGLLDDVHIPMIQVVISRELRRADAGQDEDIVRAQMLRAVLAVLLGTRE